MLAYALVLNGLLGSLAAGGHVAQARTAAELGVICTIHGVIDPATGNTGERDPTPGKLACIEHCVLATASAVPLQPAVVIAVNPPVAIPQVTPDLVRDVGPGLAPVAAPPPSRGPPALV